MKAASMDFSKSTQRLKVPQAGIALLYCLLALLILSAVTTSLILMSGTETSVNANYRSEEQAFFAAKTGIYEALDRMQQTNAASISSQIPSVTSGSSPLVLYLINAGSSLTVQPWNTSNAYFDDELCHEGYAISGMSSASPDVPCTTIGTGSTWYTTATSNYPWSGTAAAIPYEWVRINWKTNSTQTYLNGTTASNYYVNSSGSASTPVCFNGGSEFLLSSSFTSCENYLSCGATQPTIGTPVLVVTALAVTPNGSRHMVQAEAALQPPTITVQPCGITDNYGFFAYGQGYSCSNPAFILGGNASVDGYNSSVGTYTATHSNTLGRIGTNQGALAEGTSTTIGGNVYLPNIGSPPGPNQGCPGDDYQTSGSPTLVGSLVQSQPVPIPTVSIPTNNSTTNVSSGTIVPGSYRNMTVASHGSLTLTAPGTYNFDCITAGSWGTITTSPASGKITINVSGTGCSTAPINFSSHAVINNTSQVASNIQINYPGTGTLTLTGGSGMFAVINAPNASVAFNGGSDFYGTLMANFIDDHGGTNLHFDAADTTLSGQSASTATATATGSYNMLAFHSLPY